MIRVYTDGSCKPTNPGPAGYGVVIISKNGSKVESIGKYIGRATNNIAEIMGLKETLRVLCDRGEQWEEIEIHTDSQYVIGMFQKNWNAKANQELIAEVRKQLELFPNLTFKWVKAHNGDTYNEMADDLAKLAIDSVNK